MAEEDVLTQMVMEQLKLETKHAADYKEQLLKENRDLVAERKALREQCESIRQEIKDVLPKKNELADRASAEIAKLNAALTQAKRDFDTETTKIKELKSVQDENVALYERKVADIKNEMRRLKEAAAKELNEINGEIDFKRSHIRDMDAAIQSAEVRISEKKLALETANTELVSVKEKLKDSLDMLNKRVKEFDDVSVKVSMAKRVIDDTRREHDELVERIKAIKEAQTAIDLAMKEIVDQKKINSDRAAQLSEWDAELKVRSKALDQKNAHLTKREKELKDALTKI